MLNQFNARQKEPCKQERKCKKASNDKHGDVFSVLRTPAIPIAKYNSANKQNMANQNKNIERELPVAVYHAYNTHSPIDYALQTV